jgi:L-serine deaminase
MFKEAITALKACKRSGVEITELCIHMETTSGEIMELDIDLDENGDLIKECNMFDTEEDYEVYLKSEDIPKNILYN